LLVSILAPFLVFVLFALALPGQPPVGDELRLLRIRRIDDLDAVRVVAHGALHAREAGVGRGVEIGILPAAVVVAVRARSALGGAPDPFWTSRLGSPWSQDHSDSSTILAGSVAS